LIYKKVKLRGSLDERKVVMKAISRIQEGRHNKENEAQIELRRRLEKKLTRTRSHTESILKIKKTMNNYVDNVSFGQKIKERKERRELCKKFT